MYLKIARGRWKIILLTCLIGLAAGWLVTPSSGNAVAGVETFSATHILRAQSDADGTASRTDTAQNLEVAALMATVGEIPRRAADILGLDEAEIGAMVDTRTEPSVGTLAITATATDGPAAVELANTIATELVAVLTEEAVSQYNANVNQARAIIEQRQGELDGLPAGTGREDPERAAVVRRFEAASAELQRLEDAGVPTSGLVTLQEATTEQVTVGGARTATTQTQTNRRADASDQTPSATGATSEQVRPVETPPRRGLRMGIGGLVGLVLGAGLALVRERLDPRIRSRQAAELAFGLPVLAEVPKPPRRSAHGPPQLTTTVAERTLEAESYRVLRTALLFNQIHTPRSTDQSWFEQPGTSGPSSNLAIVRTAADVAKVAPDLRALADIPATASWPATEGPTLATPGAGSTAIDAYRSLATLIQRDALDHKTRTLLITSATSGEGRSTLVANLGVALARAGQHVILVDGDLRRPRLHDIFGLSPTTGLASMAAGEASLSVACQPVLGEDRLSVVVAGPPPSDPAAFLASPRTAEVLATLAAQCDILLVDTPPVLDSQDSLALAANADSAILVARGERTTASALQQATARIQATGCRLSGAVVNQSTPAPLRTSTAPDGDGTANGTTASAPVGVILVTSPGAGEGKTTTVANLAATFAETGRATLALDFDLRRPRLHEFFALNPEPGLRQVLDGEKELGDITRPTSLDHLDVAASGGATGDPARALAGSAGPLAMARSRADVIVIDTPPVLAASDAGQLITMADAVVIVCRIGTTTTGSAERTAERLARASAPALGVVLVGATATASARAYYKSTPSAGSAAGAFRTRPGRTLADAGPKSSSKATKSSSKKSKASRNGAGSDHKPTKTGRRKSGQRR